RSALNIVETVYKIYYCRLSRSGRAYKRYLLPRLCIEIDILQYHPAVIITEAYILETHVSAQRHKLAVRLMPCPSVRLFLADPELSVHFLDVHKSDLSVIRLRLHLHNIEYTLRSGKSRKQEITLLSELIYRHRRLSYE